MVWVGGWIGNIARVERLLYPLIIDVRESGRTKCLYVCVLKGNHITNDLTSTIGIKVNTRCPLRTTAFLMHLSDDDGCLLFILLHPALNDNGVESWWWFGTMVISYGRSKWFTRDACHFLNEVSHESTLRRSVSKRESWVRWPIA